MNWKRYNQQLRKAWSTLRLLYALLFYEFVFILLVVFRVLNLGEFLTIGMLELGLAILFYYLFGQHRKERLEELANLEEVADKYQHLVVHRRVRLFFGKFRRFSTVHPLFFVENTSTDCAYFCPDAFRDGALEGAIKLQTHFKKGDMDKDFQSRGVTAFDEEPTYFQLRKKEPEVEHLKSFAYFE